MADANMQIEVRVAWVPMEPTPEMLNAGAMRIAMNEQFVGTAEAKAAAVWRDMVAAAPDGVGIPAEPQWGPILDALDSWPNDCRDDDFKHLERLIRTEHARTLDRLDAARTAGVALPLKGEQT